MESAVKVYLTIYRLVHWTTLKTTGFKARMKTKFETGPRQMELLPILSGIESVQFVKDNCKDTTLRFIVVDLNTSIVQNN